MTPSSRQPNYESTAEAIRVANGTLRSGGEGTFESFRELVSRLFCLTVGHKKASVHLRRLKDGSRAELEGGYGEAPAVIRLTNDCFLRLVVALYLDPRDQYLRTSLSCFQYQTDEAGEDWVFRYEYNRTRNADEVKPTGHLHVRSALVSETALDNKRPFARVHFPCGRPTIESTIRLLIDDFGVPPDAPEEVWRPVLAESERSFLDVAHKSEVV